MRPDNTKDSTDKDKIAIRWIKDIISWVIAVGGLVVGIIGLVSKSDFEKKVVYTVIIIDSLILIGLGIYMAVAYYDKRLIIKEKDNNILKCKHKLEELEINHSEQTRAYLLLGANCNYMVSTLQKFLNRLYDLTQRSLDGTDSIKKQESDMRDHGYSEKEITQKTIAMAQEKEDNISNDLYDDYKRFLSNILGKTQDNIEKYLKTKGYDLDVSITIKQLLEPVFQNGDIDYMSKPYVYTAFRDSKTWMKKIRKEVAQRKYTINKNSDFIHCLSKGYYIFNNKTTDSKDYCNENSEFDKYYNCGMTTMIYSPKEKSDRYIYGFLACDVMNDKYANEEILDAEITNFLDIAAYIISIYFDNIDFNWVFCKISDRYKTFWNMVYSKYLVAI
ncbi:hypothetical protein [Extibacter muris]|uniref:hypothetical protein n=1 Tax=Extibacter muris TaxID=1796622 RepID=UPI001D08DBDF|nr:hypothetical protein [Extibacter muris]MCB6203538.1 hypothetical protein [Extibacter muris]MCQ4665082.1 hypothetical protein [Extibacter muris]MCQ4694448.1 hypothetical protein [Extibacter muris]